MKRLFAIGIFLIALFPLRGAADVLCPGLDQPLIPLGYQQLTISSVAVGFTLPATSKAVLMAVMMVETAAIRYRDDGTAPTSTVGTPVAANIGVVVCGAAVSSFKAIAQSSDAKGNISFYGH